jgi:hypothetical protein
MSNTDAGGERSGAQAPAGADAGRSPKEMASNAAQTVKQEAASFAADAKDKAIERVEQRKEMATQTLGEFANAIRKAGDELAEGDQSMAGRVVRQAADGLEGLARSMSDKRPEEMLDAVRDFGRRNPTAFIAGSVLAGLAIGRFLKSSSALDRPQGFGAVATSPGPDEVAASGATSIGAPSMGGQSQSQGQGTSTEPEVPPYGAGAAAGAEGEGGPELDRPRFGSGV